MLNRADRDALACTIRQYLNDEITAFDLDDKLWDIRQKTKDETVDDVAAAFWYHYDDLKDHNVVASKQEWDYFQRLLLVLESDAKIVTKRTRRWSVRQFLAAVALAGFCAAAAYLGWGEHLLIVAVPFGVVSMLLSFWSRRAARSAPQPDLIAYPFSSVSAILHALRKCPGFRKQRYPKRLRGRSIRGRLARTAAWIPALAMWLLLAPAVLFFQMLPDSDWPIVIADG